MPLVRRSWPCWLMISNRSVCVPPSYSFRARSHRGAARVSLQTTRAARRCSDVRSVESRCARSRRRRRDRARACARGRFRRRSRFPRRLPTASRRACRLRARTRLGGNLDVVTDRTGRRAAPRALPREEKLPVQPGRVACAAPLPARRSTSRASRRRCRRAALPRPRPRGCLLDDARHAVATSDGPPVVGVGMRAMPRTVLASSTMIASIFVREIDATTKLALSAVRHCPSRLPSPGPCTSSIQRYRSVVSRAHLHRRAELPRSAPSSSQKCSNRVRASPGSAAAAKLGRVPRWASP